MTTTSRWLIVTALFATGFVQAQEAATPAAPSDAAAAPSEASAAAAMPAPTQSKRRNAPDRLELDTTTVTGNRELPKVLYIVPWKKADLGDLPGQPFNTLLDEVLAPVDRDVFRREVTYYDAVAAGRGAGSAGPASESSTGKTQ